MASSPAVAAVSKGDGKQEQVQTLLSGIFERMMYPARFEFKDMADGGLGVAVHFTGELPGITPGKRSYLIDCIQFLVNKVVNRPNVEKRWVTLGINAYPEPRGQRPEPPAPSASPAPSRPQATASKQGSVAKAPASPEQPQQTARKPADPRVSAPSHQQRRGHEPDEKPLKVEPTPQMTRLGKTMAEKAAKFGRFYALPLLSADDRARVMNSAAEVKGVSLKAEGEGYFRRVVFTPAQPVVITKKQVMPDYEDDEA